MVEQPPDAATSDTRLVAHALQGDKDAFGALVERYWQTAVGIAAGRVRTMTDAEDIAQESFVTVYSKLGDLREPARFGGWLSKIVVQRSIDHIRKTAREETMHLVGDDEMLSEVQWQPTSTDGLEPEEIGAVRRAVRALPERLRQVVILRFMSGLSAGEIAERIGSKQGTVRVWLHRAAIRLEKDLAHISLEAKR